MQTGQAFNERFLPLMWNQFEGTVEVNFEESEITFTVYEKGSQAMFVMSQITGVGTRLVCLPKNLFPPTNTTNRGTRTSVLEFQLRDALTSSIGREQDLFFDFNTNRFGRVSFNQSKVTSKISRPDAKNLRNISAFNRGQIFELIQQTR